jgi:hypothetical protein
MHSSLSVLGILITVSAVLIGLWAPGRDDQQLRPVRYLLARRSRRHTRTDRSKALVAAPVGIPLRSG